MNKNDKQSIDRRSFLKLASLTAGGALLAGCGTQATEQAAQSVEQSDPTAAPVVSKETKLTIAVFGSSINEGFVASAEAFHKKFPEATVEFVPVQGIDWEEYLAKIITQSAAGNAPDLAFIATEGTQVFAGKGLGTPLDDFIKRDKDEIAEYFADVHPALIDAMMYEGSLYELPTDFNAANMYYNPKLFAEAGFDAPAANWTKDDFYTIAKAITQQGSGGETGVFGYGWTNRLWGSWLPWIFVNGGNLMSEAQASGGEWMWETFYADDAAAKGRKGGPKWVDATANSGNNIEALEFMVALMDEGVTPSIDLGGGNSLENYFIGGNLGMTPAGGFWVAGLSNAGMTDYDVQLWPKWQSQRHQLGCAGFAIMNEAKDKDLAWEWCKHFASKSSMEQVFSVPNTTPTRRSMVNAEFYEGIGPKHWQVFYDTLDDHPDTAPIPAPPQCQELTNLFTKYTGLAMAKEQTPKEALDAMQSDLEDLLSRTG